MSERKRNGSNLFLIELMLSIFFFIVTVAICVQLFSYAYDTSKASEKLVESVNICTNIAEYFTTCDEKKVDFNKIYDKGFWSNGEFLVMFDEDFDQIETNGRYCLKVHISNNGNIQTAGIAVYDIIDGVEDESKPIFKLRLERLVYEK